jgi:uncharacterized RmlC-like cupin family protein
MRTRPLIATAHGFTSFFVGEFEMDEGASVPLHTHPIEEAIVVTEGLVTIQLGEEIIAARAGSIVRIPPGVPTHFGTRRRIRLAAWAERLGIRQTSSVGLRLAWKEFHQRTEARSDRL